MKVLGIACSPRKGGNTEILVREALKGAEDAGAEVEFLTTSGRNIKPCDDCKACLKKGECHTKDDVQEIYEKLLAADGIIFGTPVYFYDVSGQAKVLIDRTRALLHPYLRLSNKVAGAIAVAARSGSGVALDVLQRFFVTHHMITAELEDGLADKRGEVIKDKRGMKGAWELGRLVALLVAQRRYPEEYNYRLYRIVEEKYNLEGWPLGHARKVKNQNP
jgi:multimeric flavodoxin WrbA